MCAHRHRIAWYTRQCEIKRSFALPRLTIYTGESSKAKAYRWRATFLQLVAPVISAVRRVFSQHAASCYLLVICYFLDAAELRASEADMNRNFFFNERSCGLIWIFDEWICEVWEREKRKWSYTSKFSAWCRAFSKLILECMGARCIHILARNFPS